MVSSGVCLHRGSALLVRVSGRSRQTRRHGLSGCGRASRSRVLFSAPTSVQPALPRAASRSCDQPRATVPTQPPVPTRPPVPTQPPPSAPRARKPVPNVQSLQRLPIAATPPRTPPRTPRRTPSPQQCACTHGPRASTISGILQCQRTREPRAFEARVRRVQRVSAYARGAQMRGRGTRTQGVGARPGVWRGRVGAWQRTVSASEDNATQERRGSRGAQTGRAAHLGPRGGVHAARRGGCAGWRWPGAGAARASARAYTRGIGRTGCVRDRPGECHAR